MGQSEFQRSAWQKRLSITYATLSGAFYMASLIFYVLNRAYIQTTFTLINPLLTTAIFIFLAALLTYRRPENPISWLLVIVALLNQTSQLSMVFTVILARGVKPSPTMLLLSVLGTNVTGLAYSILAYIFILFPYGRLPSKRWAAAKWLLGLITLSTVGRIAFSITQDNFVQVENMSFVLTNPFSILTLFGAFVLIFLALLSQIKRFKSGSSIERQQIKWVLFAIFVWVFGGLLNLTPPLRQSIFILALITPILPASIVITILRYRLYDIDIIIRRTLQYGLLTGILVVIYFGLVILVQASAGALTGQANSSLVNVLSTLGIAALFNPLRRRLQDFIDRHFYRSKFDAEKTLARFAITSRAEVDLETLAAEILNLVDETIQPNSATLWLREISK